MPPRTIVVTGTSSGLGKAIVEEFASQGWSVAATVREPAQHRELFARWPNVRLFSLDLTRQGQIDRLATEVLASYGPPDVLVNNAGQLLLGPLETNTSAQIRALYETNLFGLIAVTKAFLPALRERRAGTIVNIASASAIASSPFLSAYSSSKWAVAGLSEALAIELAPFGISVKAIFPGVHATRMFTSMSDGLTPNGVTAASEEYRPFVANFLALQHGVPSVRSPRKLARLVYRLALTDDGRMRYIAGPDARITAVLKTLLPQRTFQRALLGSILRPPSGLLLRLSRLLMRGGEPLETRRQSTDQGK